MKYTLKETAFIHIFDMGSEEDVREVARKLPLPRRPPMYPGCLSTEPQLVVYHGRLYSAVCYAPGAELFDMVIEHHTWVLRMLTLEAA